MTLHTLFPLALVCHCCSTSIPLFRSHSTLSGLFFPCRRLRCYAAQASTKATPAPQDDRRARIRARTATVDDYQAEIAAQERELSAAVEERKQIDSKLEAAETRQAKYEKELKKCEQKLAAKQSRADIVKLERKKERLEASIKDVLEQKEDLREDRRPLAAHIKELRAAIAAETCLPSALRTALDELVGTRGRRAERDGAKGNAERFPARIDTTRRA